MKHTKATRLKMSKARKAYWKNKAIQKDIEDKEAIIAHVKQHEAMHKNGLFGTVLKFFGL